MKNIFEIQQAAAQAGVAIVPTTPADKSMPSGVDPASAYTFTAWVSQPEPLFG